MLGRKHRKRRARPEGPAPDINVTPLVDIVLVLLIIFMVVTPAIAQGETIELPEVVRIDKKPKEFEPHKLVVSADGALILNSKRIARPNLEPRLRELHAKNPNRQLLLNIDSKVSYVHVRQILALLQNLGMKGVSLKVNPKKTETLP
jgi:biopolymer transport protein ExbD